MRTEIDNNKIRQQKKFLDFFVVTKQLQAIILRGGKDMASFHAIEQGMNMIITREGDPMYQDIPDDPVDYIDDFRFIRAENIKQWRNMIVSDKWFAINSRLIIDTAIDECKQNKIISIDEYFDESDKTQINNRILAFVKHVHHLHIHPFRVIRSEA